MLILSRQTGQSLIIGDDITITVQAIKGNQVSLGISAPASVCIDRREVREAKEAMVKPKHAPQGLWDYTNSAIEEKP